MFFSMNRQRSDTEQKDNPRDRIPAAQFTVDDNGCFTHTSPQFNQLLGFKDGELLGKQFISILHKEKTALGLKTDLSMHFLRRCTEAPVDMELYDKQRTRIPVRITVSLEKNSRGTVTEAHGAAEDLRSESTTVSRHLHEAAHTLKTLLDNSGDGIIIHNANGYIVMVNDVFAKILGYAQEELTGKHLFVLTPLSGTYRSSTGYEIIIDEAYIQTQLQKANELFEKNSITYTLYYLHKNGTVLPVEATYSVLYDYSGTQSGTVGIVRDITQRSIREQERKQNEERYKSLAESVFDAIISINSSGHIIFCNNASLRMFGYDRADMIGSPVQKLLPPEKRKKDKTAMEQLFAVNTSQAIDSTIEITCIKKDRTPFFAELSLSKWEQDGAAFATAVIRDVTEKKQAEDALRESEERFRVLALSATDAVILVDGMGTIVFWNTSAQEIYGYSENEIVGRSLEIIVPEQYRHYHKNLFNHYDDYSKKHTDTGMTIESYGLRKNGTVFPAEIAISSSTIGNNQFFCAVVRDITTRKLYEKKIQSSKEFLENIFKTIGDGIIVTDSRGLIIRINNAVEEILGFSEQELKGKHMSELVPVSIKNSSYLVSVKQMQKRLFEMGMVDTFESVWAKKDGASCPVDLRASVLKDADGNITGTVTAVRDITESKQAEEQLRESEEKFRALATSAPEAIIAVDSHGAIIFWNAGAENIFGYTEKEILGKNASVLVPERFRKKDATGFLTFKKEDFKKFKTKKIEATGRRKDGKEFADEISISAWQTRSGIYYIAIIRDVTERNRAVDALKQSQRRFKDLTDSLPQTIFETTPDGMITFFNRTALHFFGYTEKDFLNPFYAEQLFVPEQRLLIRDNLKKVLEGEHLGGHEYSALRKDGTIFPVSVYTSPVMHGKKTVGLRGIIVDISERKRFEEEFFKAQRLQSIAALAGGVAQDFKTILSTVLGNISIAQQYVMPDEKIHEPLLLAERETLRAKDLTDQLMTFSSGSHGEKKVDSIEPVLKEAAGIALKGAPVESCLSFPEDPWLTEMDVSQIKQVFINLFINAEHAMPEGGKINVAVENKTIGPGDNLPLINGRYVKIIIQDQSIGILNEHLQHIFDPYFKSKSKGSGIGLATIYSIIKNHGGLVTVESEFGKGTTFYIYLPAQYTEKK